MKIDQRIYDRFFQAASDRLHDAERVILQMESERSCAAGIGELYRILHTLKGDAAALGFAALKEWAHTLETLIGAFRKTEMKEVALFVELVWAGMNHSRVLLEQSQKGLATTRLSDQQQTFLGILKNAVDQWQPVPAREIPSSGDDDSRKALARILALLDSQNPAGEIRAESLLPILEKVRDRFKTAGETALRNALDKSLAFITSISDDEGRLDAWAQKNLAASMHAALDAWLSAPAADNHGLGSIRVPEKSLSDIDVAIRNVQSILEDFSSIRKTLPQASHGEYDLALQNLVLWVRVVRGMLQKTRQETPQLTMSKMCRLVEALADSLGKKVILSTKGDEVLVDKGTLNVLDTVLIHIVRNAVDHGIEPVEQRVGLGKSPEGRIEISFVPTPDRLTVTVSDDGAGIDLAAVQQAAVQDGHAPGNSADGGMELIFQPGVTTRRKIGGVSGRGVGLDVVKTSLDRIGGQIRVQSRSGGGTLFIIDLPVAGSDPEFLKFPFSWKPVTHE